MRSTELSTTGPDTSRYAGGAPRAPSCSGSFVSGPRQVSSAARPLDGRRSTAAGNHGQKLKMRLEDLDKELTARGLSLEVQALWHDYLEDGGSGNPELFLGWLHDRGEINTYTFSSLLSTSRLEIDHGGFSAWDPHAQDGSGRYQALGILGEGGMGQVNAVRDLRLKRNIAVKELLGKHAAKPETVARFFNEIQITAQLEHPNIVSVHALETERENPAYSMQLVHGRTLAEYLAETRAFFANGSKPGLEHSRGTRLGHFLTICGAVSYAHSRGVVHRDLKPDNIMIGGFNDVYLVDWGIAKLIGEQEPMGNPSASSELDQAVPATMAGQIRGTPTYMSPEQAHGDEVGPAGDQFALGLILYELVTLQRGRRGTGIQLLTQAGEGTYAPIEHMAADVNIPKELKLIIEKATAYHARDRYPDVSTLADDVRRHLRGHSTLVRPDNPWRKLLRLVGRHRETMVFLVISAFLAAGALTALNAHRVSRAAQIREHRLGIRLAAVAQQAAAADRYFLRLESLVTGLADSAHHLLTYARPSAEPTFTSHDFDQPPPTLDLIPGRRYSKPVSFEHAVYKLAPGIQPESVQADIQRLAPLRLHFRRLFLHSFQNPIGRRDPATVDTLLAEQGAPLVWAYVGLETGVHMAFPGGAGYPQSYDPRRRPWYRLGIESPLPSWGRPYIDALGQGLILPCVVAVPGSTDPGDEQPIGVAGIELTLDRVIDALLVNPALQDVHETYLLDSRGHIMVRTGSRGVAYSGGLHGNRALETEPLAVPKVLAAMQDHHTGHVELHGRLYVFHRLDALGWYLLVAGPSML